MYNFTVCACVVFTLSSCSSIWDLYADWFFSGRIKSSAAVGDPGNTETNNWRSGIPQTCKKHAQTKRKFHDIATFITASSLRIKASQPHFMPICTLIKNISKSQQIIMSYSASHDGCNVYNTMLRNNIESTQKKALELKIQRYRQAIIFVLERLIVMEFCGAVLRLCSLIGWLALESLCRCINIHSELARFTLPGRITYLLLSLILRGNQTDVRVHVQPLSQTWTSPESPERAIRLKTSSIWEREKRIVEKRGSMESYQQPFKKFHESFSVVHGHEQNTPTGARDGLLERYTWVSVALTTRPTSCLHSATDGLCSSRLGENDSNKERKNSANDIKKENDEWMGETDYSSAEKLLNLSVAEMHISER